MSNFSIIQVESYLSLYMLTYKENMVWKPTFDVIVLYRVSTNISYSVNIMLLLVSLEIQI